MEQRIEDLNKEINSYFFSKFNFILDGKIIKEGKLKLFSMKSFNLRFFLIDENNNIKTLEMPYPFRLIKHKSGYVFDYRLEAFRLLKKTELLDKLIEENFVKSRYFDKQLIVKIE